MKIVIDCRFVRTDQHDGVSRFTVGLVTELVRLHPVTALVSDPAQLALLPQRLPYAMIIKPTSVWEPFVALAVNRLAPDVVFSPLQTMGSFARRYRLVLTVHDVIYYRHRTPPRDLPWGVRLLWRLYHLNGWPQRLLLRRADAVVAVSETTRAELRARRLTRRPVVVVPNAAGAPGADPEGDPRTEERSDSRSLIYMGSFMPYKNVETLVRAVALLPGYRLHLMSRITSVRRAQLQRLAPDADLVFHDGASDHTYQTLLSAALALVSASRDEGFGLPLVEAMAAATPLVVSDIPIFHEVAGAAALFAAEDDPAAFAAAIRSLADGPRWLGFSTAARVQAARFSWSTSARRLLAILSEVARAPRPER